VQLGVVSVVRELAGTVLVALDLPQAVPPQAGAVALRVDTGVGQTGIGVEKLGDPPERVRAVEQVAMAVIGPALATFIEIEAI